MRDPNAVVELIILYSQLNVIIYFYYYYIV